MKKTLLGFGSLTLLGTLGTVIALTGCGRIDASGFEGSTPTKDTVAFVVPGSSTAASANVTAGGVTTRKGALLGDESADYTLTVGVTAIVNTGVGAVLDLVKTVVGYPATSVEGDVAVWGPHTDPLSANTWRLTVTRVAPHQFSWQFDGKAKTADDSAFVTVLSGMHAQALDAAGHAMEGFGSGNFTLDFDAADTLPQHDANVGQAAFSYSKLDPSATVTVGVTFTGIRDNCDPNASGCHTSGNIFNAVYAYSATPGNGGDLQYGAAENFDTATTAYETLSLHSRWQETGAGRTDIQLTGGDLGTTVQTSSECWDSNFASVYSAVPSNPSDATMNWGAESSCAAPFQSAAFVSLSPSP
jgi:hypothetical protein